MNLWRLIPVAKANASKFNDDHFNMFAVTLRDTIATMVDVEAEPNLLLRQKFQMETLFALEKEFRKLLVAHKWGLDVYESFIARIANPKEMGGNGNVLTARPYFREAAVVCIGPICKILQDRNAKKLQKYHFNYNFILFTIKNKNWSLKHPLRKLERQIRNLRQEIIVTNMPLAISRARIFWNSAVSRDPKNNLTYMDLVQLSSEGLAAAVDKYRFPFTQGFRNAIINRVSSVFIESYSATDMHFFPKDKRKLYRGNKFMKRFQGTVDFVRLSEYVNEELEPGQRTTPEEIAQLMAAASIGSIDAPIMTGSEGSGNRQETTILDTAAATSDCEPEERTANAELNHKLAQYIEQLPMFDQKLLRLRGVSL
jgi:DNA-directed RNA polymerase specialized sigma subunit